MNWVPAQSCARVLPFAHALWNKFAATQQGKIRTNNVEEGYNYAFGLSLPSRATVWTLMDRSCTEDATLKTFFTRPPLTSKTRMAAGPSRGLPVKISWNPLSTTLATSLSLSTWSLLLLSLVIYYKTICMSRLLTAYSLDPPEPIVITRENIMMFNLILF